MKAARRIAAVLQDDRKMVATRDGRTLESLARDAGATSRRDEKANATLFTFKDGSRIVKLPGRWDYGFTGCDCSCRTGAGHQQDCPHQPGPTRT
jgi:hypothetical protein